MPGLTVFVLLCANAYFLTVALLNVIFFRRSTEAPRITAGPFVSVVVPARNEERAIARCLESLTAQDYADYEIVVVDDESSDGTARIVAGVAERDPRVRLVTGKPLAEGWLGKSHALSQGVAAARGDVLIFTDADTVHTPQSVSWAVTNLTAHRADILSGYLAQEYGSFGERLIVPTMYAAMLLVPLFLLPRVRSSQLSFAIGQYVVLRRAAFDGAGGFEAIHGSIVDDVSLAKQMKQTGYRNVFLDASAAARCRLYTGYANAFLGISRSIYSALGANLAAAVAVAAAILALIVWPPFAVLSSALSLTWPAMPVVTATTLFAIQWALVTWDRDVPFTAFALYPVVFLNLVAILLVSMVRTGLGSGVEWKGRKVRAGMAADAAEEARLADEASRLGKVR